MKSINNFGRYFTAILVLATFATSSFGQKLNNDAAQVKMPANLVSAPNALVTPVQFLGPGPSGNPDCATLNALHPGGPADIRFSHIIHDNELKLDFSNPNGTFPFTNSDPPNPRIVVGPQDASQSVTISSDEDEIFSWSSTLQITAVIMKMGNDAYVYPYKPFKNSDTNLKPSDAFPTATIGGLSHVTFCFGDPTNPTAGEGSVSGRVVDSNGYGISRAQMVLINGTTGEAKITMTSPFGYYTFVGLDVNELYILNVSHKRFVFGEKQRTITLDDNLTDVDFVGQSRE